MYNCVLKNCTNILRKSTIIPLSSFNLSAKSHAYTNVQKLLKTSCIQRNFYNNTNNYYAIETKTIKEQDLIDTEQLNEYLKDSENEKQFKLIKYEYEYMKYNNEDVPHYIRPKDWIYLLKLSSKTRRRKYLSFLFLNQMKAINHKAKHQKDKEMYIKMLEEQSITCPSALEYGLGKNNMFLRIYDKTMDFFYNYKMILSTMYEPIIVFDCGYDDVMSDMELNNCAKQISICMASNRIHISPAPMYLCNASKTNKIVKNLSSMIRNLYEDNCPIQLTSQSYLDIFDKDKLVYLTPHCREEMKSFNPDKIYILGAMVDKSNPRPYSLAKAKKDGIRMERLPLDKYFEWNTGSSKSLTLNQVLGILLDVKYTKDWHFALSNNVPKRKLRKLVTNETTNTNKIVKEINK